MVEIPPSTLAAAVASLLYVLLGIVVFTAAPRALANRAFALFAVFSGLAGMLDRLFIPLEIASSTYFAWGAPLYALTMLGIVALSLTFPEPPTPQESRFSWCALGLGSLLAGLLVWAWVSWYEDRFAVVAVFAVIWGLVMVVGAASTTLFAFRAAASPRLLPSYAAMALAVYLPVALGVGNTLDGGSSRFIIFSVSNIVVVVLSWFWATVRVAQPAWAIAVIWASLGAALAAQLTDPVSGSGFDAWDATVAVIRLLAIAILAFMILRGQVSGLEMGVRWGVSRGTVAAAFVATFFVASEGAQMVFGRGNEWVGLFAAGALVFAIAPLQRAAERLAEKAVPVAMPVAVQAALKSPASTDDREDVYRNSLRLALRDSRIARDEERHFFRLARSLHIDAERAHDILVEVESEQEREVP